MYWISFDDLPWFCVFDLEFRSCPGEKRVAYQNIPGVDNKKENYILIEYDENKHKCLAKHKAHETAMLEMQAYFERNPNIKPTGKMFSHCLM